MANTGKVIVLTLKEEHSSNGAATGNIKDNISTDSDYIASYLDVSKCALTYTLTCPVVKATGLPSSIYFEFGLPNSTLFNPTLVTIKIKAMLSGVEQAHIDYTLPNSTKNYFTGTFSGLTTATTYTLEIDYLDGSSTLLSNCPSLTSVTTT